MVEISKNNQKKDEREIDQLIFDIAENNLAQDYTIFYNLMIGKTVFLPVEENSIPKNLVPGESFKTDSSMQIRVKSVTGPNGELFMPCAINENAKFLLDSYIGIDWIEYLNMVLKTPSAWWGALIQGKTSYVGFDKMRIQHILSQ